MIIYNNDECSWRTCAGGKEDSRYAALQGARVASGGVVGGGGVGSGYTAGSGGGYGGAGGVGSYGKGDGRGFTAGYAGGAGGVNGGGSLTSFALPFTLHSFQFQLRILLHHRL